MSLYESTFIARQDLSRQDVARLTEQFTSIIQNGGGKVVKNEYWGLRSLAFKIKKNRKGHYAMLGIDAPAEAVKELERNMLINEEVIRMLTVRVEELPEGPSPMMQQRGSREDGPEIADDAPVVVAEESIN